MALYVHKYGGTSLGDVEQLLSVAKQINKFKQDGHDVVVVVSAISGETNRLVEFAISSCSCSSASVQSQIDILLSTGEQVTLALLAIALYKQAAYTGSQVGIHTDSVHMRANLHGLDLSVLHSNIRIGRVVVVAGFQGTDQSKSSTTLGRGGSDTTAVALAALLEADECKIYKDVDGVYTTDPRVCYMSRMLQTIMVEEMLELSSIGYNVLHIHSVELVGKYNVQLRVLSSCEESNGTLIVASSNYLSFVINNMMNHHSEPLISGIAFNKNSAKITVLNVPDVPCVATKIIGPIASAHIDVDIFIKNAAPIDGYTDLTLTVSKQAYKKTYQLLRQTLRQTLDVVGDDKIAKVTLVGIGMRCITSRMFSVLSEELINVRMVSTSEIKISFVIDKNVVEQAVSALHTSFCLDQANVLYESEIGEVAEWMKALPC